MSNLNEAVCLIIERLKTDPEDFWGPIAHDNPYVPGASPKFRGIARDIEECLLGVVSEGALIRDRDSRKPLWFLTDEERKALCDAYTEAKRERFTAEIFHTLLTQPEEDQPIKFRTQGKYANVVGASMTATGAALTGSIQNTYGNEAMRIDSSGNLGIGTGKAPW